MRLTLIALAACALASPPALAQQHDHDEPACTVMDASLPDGLKDWNRAAAMDTAGGETDVFHAKLTLGHGYEVTLKKKADVIFAVEPEKPGGSVSYSGLFAFDAPEAGNYVIALGTAAWIDVVEDGKALEPLSFGHGPACTTIRKMVVYGLKPGRHLLQIAGNGGPSAKLLVAKQP